MQTGRILVTEYCGKILVCHMVGNKPDRVFLEDPSAADLPVGTVVIAKVKKIVSGIHAAFVTLGTDGEYFMALPVERDRDVLLVNRPYDGIVKCGDEIVVQVKKQAMKMKQPVVDCHISFAGRYAVLQTGHKGFHISSKLNRNQKESFDELRSEFSFEEEIIIRTNAAEVPLDDVRQDIKAVKEQLETIKRIYQYRTCHSILLKALPEYLTMIRDISVNAYDEIVTDSIRLKETMEAALSEYAGMPAGHVENTSASPVPKIRLYEDASYPLIKLYSIETALKELSERKVWLKSGGFLIFDQTETLTAIDVNTGKNEKKKDAAYATNMEAVPEICRQLRARNISGMILIDFINLTSEEQIGSLTGALKAELKKDYVKASFIDISGLGLFEVTREKKLASLKEILQQA